MMRTGAAGDLETLGTIPTIGEEPSALKSSPPSSVPSPPPPRPTRPVTLATVVVLVTAYFFALVPIVGSAVIVSRGWQGLRAWAAATPWRTGFLTATFVLVGGAAAVAYELHEYPHPDDVVRSALADGGEE